MVKKESSRRMNPGDLQRRKDKARLLEKNKQERQKFRIMAKIRLDPEGIKAEYTRLENKVIARKLDSNDKRRWAELKEMGQFIDKCIDEKTQEKDAAGDEGVRDSETELASIAAHVREQKRAAAASGINKIIPPQNENDSYSYYSEEEEESNDYSDPSTPSDQQAPQAPPSSHDQPNVQMPQFAPYQQPVMMPCPWGYQPQMFPPLLHNAMVAGIQHPIPNMHPGYGVMPPVMPPTPQAKQPPQPLLRTVEARTATQPGTAKNPHQFVPTNVKLAALKNSGLKKSMNVMEVSNIASEAAKEQIERLYKLPTINQNMLSIDTNTTAKDETYKDNNEENLMKEEQQEIVVPLNRLNLNRLKDK